GGCDYGGLQAGRRRRIESGLRTGGNDGAILNISACGSVDAPGEGGIGGARNGGGQRIGVLRGNGRAGGIHLDANARIDIDISRSKSSEVRLANGHDDEGVCQRKAAGRRVNAALRDRAIAGQDDRGGWTRYAGDGSAGSGLRRRVRLWVRGGKAHLPVNRRSGTASDVCDEGFRLSLYDHDRRLVRASLRRPDRLDRDTDRCGVASTARDRNCQEYHRDQPQRSHSASSQAPRRSHLRVLLGYVLHNRSESPANGEAERALRFNESCREPLGLRSQKLVKLRHDNGVVDAQALQILPFDRIHCKSAGKTAALAARGEPDLIHARPLNRLSQTRIIVRVIETEWRLDDWQLNHQLDASGRVRNEIRTWDERQIVGYFQGGEIGIRILFLELRHRLWIESQLGLPQDAVESEVVKDRETNIVLVNGYAVLRVQDELGVAAGPRGEKLQRGNCDSLGQRLPIASDLGRVQIGDARASQTRDRH